MSQVQDFQLIMHDILAEGMVLSETFQVAVMIENLPPGWVDFKNYLKHKQKEMIVEELVVRLRIEEDNCMALKGNSGSSKTNVVANVVEDGQSSKSKGKKFAKGKSKAKSTHKKESPRRSSNATIVANRVTRQMNASFPRRSEMPTW